MRKKLIPKGLSGWEANNLYKKNYDLNLQQNYIPQDIKLEPLTTPLASKISPNLTKLSDSLNDKGFQQRMLKGQNDYFKKQKWNNFTQDITKFGKDTKEFLGSDIGKQLIDKTVDTGLNLGLSALGKEQSQLGSSINAIADMAGNFGPYGQIAKYTLKGLQFANTALGSNTENFSGNTGLSGYEDYSSVGKQYDLTASGAANREKKRIQTNKKLFTTAKTNADTLLTSQQARVQATGNQGMTNANLLNNNFKSSVLTAKKGVSLQDIRNYINVKNIKKESPQIANFNSQLEKNDKLEIEKFQNGGSVIPSGALHKNKHNLETINDSLQGEITKKGIPVISYAEKGDVLEYSKDGKTPQKIADGGEIIQHAEIEKDEIILNLSLTKKLIELMNKNTEEATIQAGKILSIELMENTTDNSGILEKILENEN